jgi:hypothetical protein
VLPAAPDPRALTQRAGRFREYGLPVLGVVVLATGVLQLLMGALKLGRWFRAISVAIVEGMLAGIGLVLIAGQLYSMAGAKAPAEGLAKIAGLSGMLADAIGSPGARAALGLGAGTIAVLVLWKKLPKAVQVIPAPLAAVGLATAASTVLGLPVAKVEVRGLLGSLQPPSPSAFGDLMEVGVLSTVLAFTLIASAESLFSATAVDRLHDGPRTQYDKECLTVRLSGGGTGCVRLVRAAPAGAEKASGDRANTPSAVPPRRTAPRHARPCRRPASGPGVRRRVRRSSVAAAQSQVTSSRGTYRVLKVSRSTSLPSSLKTRSTATLKPSSGVCGTHFSPEPSRVPGCFTLVRGPLTDSTESYFLVPRKVTVTELSVARASM